MKSIILEIGELRRVLETFQNFLAVLDMGVCVLDPGVVNVVERMLAHETERNCSEADF